MSEIQRSTSGGPLSAADAAKRLKNAPDWFIQKVNANRQLRGLATLPVRRPAAAPVRRKPPAKSAPAAKLPAAPVRRSPGLAPPPLPKIGFCLAPGVGTITGDRRELFEPGAWNAFFALAKRGRLSTGFTIRTGGHSGPVAACNADGSLAFALDPVAGPIVIWQPNGADFRHRAIVETVRAGLDRLSCEFHPISLRWDGGVRRVTMAMATGCALLRRSEEPAYRGAMAMVFDGKKPLASEVRRLVDKALARAEGKA